MIRSLALTKKQPMKQEREKNPKLDQTTFKFCECLTVAFQEHGECILTRYRQKVWALLRTLNFLYQTRSF
jgi:hypothetical protein